MVSVKTITLLRLEKRDMGKVTTSLKLGDLRHHGYNNKVKVRQ